MQLMMTLKAQIKSKVIQKQHNCIDILFVIGNLLSLLAIKWANVSSLRLKFDDVNDVVIDCIVMNFFGNVS